MALTSSQISPGIISGFKTVQLLQDQILGIGSYGKVCKAKCDDLLCAAKILHSTLFDPIEQRQQAGHHRLPIRRFERECEFMSTIRHPNIVQFLGTTQESEMHLPVILMELMDESLTHFLKLKSSTQPIPYHIQVNICHDIILALSFLHSNSIIHRDLSSNNVLLMGNSRAKVTDFGMARLNEINPQSSCLTFTLCPGTDVYMPPEAVQDKPVYTEKIDCFSFGVLIVQILTRQYPKPGERHQGTDMSLPGVPRGRVVICMSEIDRRKNHINLIEPNHPLLAISLDCLKDNDFDRPTAQQLCRRVSVLKECNKYKESVQYSNVIIEAEHPRNAMELEGKEQELKSVKQQYTQHIEDLQRTILSLKNNLAEANQRLEQQAQIIQRKEEAIARQCHIIQEKEHIISESLQKKELEVHTKDEEIFKLRDQLQQTATQLLVMQESLKVCKQASVQNQSQHVQQVIEQKDAVIVSREHDIRELRKQLEQTKAQVGKEIQARKGVEKQLETSEEFLGRFQTRIGELEQQLKVQQEVMTTAAQLQEQKGHQQQQQLQKQPPFHQPPIASRPGVENRRRAIRLRWRKGSVAPSMMQRGPDAFVSGSHVYFVASKTSGGSPIFHYDVTKNAWFQLNPYPYCMSGYSVVILNKFLTGIGGMGDNGYTNKLMSLKVEGGAVQWVEHFPPMPTKRAHTSVLVSGVNLIVIGGQDSNGPVSVTEVMNIDTQQWFTSIPLPQPLTKASVTVCGDRIYMLGGEEKNFKSTKNVYSCPLNTLTQPGPRYEQPNPSVAKHLSALSLNSVPGTNRWGTVASLPVVYSTCISFHGHLLALGGEDSDKKSTTAVHTYDFSSNTWTLCNHLLIARTRCFAAVLPNNQLMVVGGWTKRALLLFVVETNEIEFGTII